MVNLGVYSQFSDLRALELRYARAVKKNHQDKESRRRLRAVRSILIAKLNSL